ncbi:DNA primase, partial [Candidatus Saccharibacteria bacterium]|nr:DNA primase [Candidatus Saccharibacteria bacterium]
VARYLELKRSGRNFKALSPFSQEKTASLMVSPEKQIWHDFSSGKGGDMFTFVMEVDGLDFKGALDILARQAGVDLSLYRHKSEGQFVRQKEQIYKVLELATKYYQLCLQRSKSTLKYIYDNRQFTLETSKMFRLGYSPNHNMELVSFLKSKGFSEDTIQKAGLGTRRYKGFGDMFRGRLMIPLQDPEGRVIGFTARLLSADNNSPKYINTPQSPVYDKSRHVFGLHLAKTALRVKDYAIVVEGNLDVIASHQSGVDNVVATAGTALTEAHLKSLSRFTSDIRLAFDQDEAGLKATERAIGVANKVGVSLSIISLPEGKDPDELVKKDASLWREAVDKPLYAIDWIIGRYQQKLDLRTAQGKKEFSNKVLALIEQLTDTVEKDHYLHLVAELLGVSVVALRQKSKTISVDNKIPNRLRPVVTQSKLDKMQADSIKLQNKILALTLHLPSLRSYLDLLTTDMFSEQPAKKLLQFLKSNLEFNIDTSYNDRQLQNISDYVTVLSLVYDELYRNLDVVELRYESARLQIRRIETYVKTQKARLAKAMANANENDLERLLEAAKRLDVLLRTAKETTK